MGKEATTPYAPRVAADLAPRLEKALVDELEWVDALVTGSYVGQRASDIDLHGSRLVGVGLAGADIERLRATDTVFDDCDLSSAFFRDANLTRVVFHRCRMSGVAFAAARLQDVAFSDCKLDDASFRMAKGQRVDFSACILRGADFAEARITEARFLDSDLTAADVTKATLGGARFHGSTLDDLKGALALRGVVIDATQLIPLSLRLLAGLGIVVDDGDLAADEIE